MGVISLIVRFKLGWFTCLIGFVEACVCGQSAAQHWHLSAVNLPPRISIQKDSAPIVVAIVDDGIRGTHETIQPFLWRNPREVSYNGVDDDENGAVDDVSGWDVSDGDPNTTPPPSRLEEFYHGTHLAGVVAQIANRVLGEEAHNYIKILPVKSISDYSQRSYLKEGFKGIEYAVSVGADIILCAWNVGRIKADEARILQQAAQKGCFVVAAAGNFPDNHEVFPAAHDTVFAVAGLGRNKLKMPESNYGTFVDLSAPGVDILGAGTASNQAVLSKSGTSQASAIVAGAAALLKLSYPEYSRLEMEMALKNASQPLAIDNPLWNGRLGRGRLDVAAALASDALSPRHSGKKNLDCPQGFLHFRSAGELTPVTWEIKHETSAKGTWLSMAYMNSLPGDGLLQIFPTENGVPQADKRQSVRLDDLRAPIWIEGVSPVVMFYPDKEVSPLEWVIRYQVQPVDLAARFCEGVRQFSQPGTIEDGSGDAPYSPQTNCKWHITAPKGKVVRFHFSKFDTESENDSLYFFNGRETQKNTLAIFSGHEIPSDFDSLGPEVIIWFLSDDQNQADGWKLDFEFVTPY